MSGLPQLVAEPREAMGKQIKQLRAQGLIPAVLHGRGIKGRQLLTVQAKEFERLYQDTGTSEPLLLKIGRTTRRVLVHEPQFDHMHRHFIHIEFLAR